MKSIPQKLKNEILDKAKEGYQIKQLAKNYGIARSTLNNWISTEKFINDKPITYKQYYDLKNKYDKLLNKYKMITTLHCFEDFPISMKKKAIEKYYNEFQLNEMCRFLKISKSTIWEYHKSLSKMTYHEKNNEILKNEIKAIYKKTHARAGYKMTHELLRKKGFHVGYTKVASLMKELELKSRFKKSRTIPIEKIKHYSEKKDLIKQNFTPEAPNMIWASDVTELLVGVNKVYLCVILDLYAKSIIAYRVCLKNDTNLVVNTFKDAFESRNRPTSLIFHSDQGANYTSYAFMQLLNSLNVRQSFSKPGCPYDNACIESFFSKYKQESYNSSNFNSFDDLCMDVDSYMDYYNNYRLKKETKMPPLEYEKLFYSKFHNNIYESPKNRVQINWFDS